jgi:ribosomal protein L17
MYKKKNESIALKLIKTEKVIKKDKLIATLKCSDRTVQRRLKEWRAHTSYNKNGQYYTLPNIPEFDQYGLWKFKGIFFSKYGNLKKTVETLIEQSLAGLNAFELTEILGVPAHTFLSHFNFDTSIQKEKYQELYVYFSNNPGMIEKQKYERNKIIIENASRIELPLDSEAIIILTEFIKHPSDSVEQLTLCYRQKHINVSQDKIRNLLIYHDLLKKQSGFLPVKGLKIHIDRLIEQVSVETLFSKPPVLTFKNERTTCSFCGLSLNVLKTKKRIISTLEIGQFHAHEVILHCQQCKCTYTSDELSKLVPRGSHFGFDILVYIGISLFLQGINEKNIQAQLLAKNVHISIREIRYLGKRFIIYLALAHKDAKEEIKEFLLSNGGYILHLDSTCEGESPHIMTILDEIAGIILGNIKLPSENSDMIVPFLSQIQQDYGDPMALVHDMAKGILKAIEIVFPFVADFICHFHFLRDIGKDLFEQENTLIRNSLRTYKIKSLLREQSKKLKKLIENDPILTENLTEYQTNSMEHKNSQKQNFSLKLLPQVAGYTLILWILDAKSELDGYGFPFDRFYLVFYQRLKTALATLNHLTEVTQNHQVFSQLQAVIATVIEDDDLKKTVVFITKKVEFFEKLRKAMRIAQPLGKNGLKDDGGDIPITNIKTKVTKFRHLKKLQQAAKTDVAIQNMIKQIDKYWEKLLEVTIKTTTAAGEIIIQPLCPHNILEQFFREIKHSYRKKNGMLYRSKTLTGMVADTPLIKNLENPKYLEIILNGKKSLAERFTDIDVHRVHQELKEQHYEGMPLPLKKALRKPNFLTQLITLTKTQSN